MVTRYRPVHAMKLPAWIRLPAAVVPLLRLLLGFLLAWAAISKLANPAQFLGSIFAYELPLPRILQQTAAVVLPWLELLCGLLLLVRQWERAALAWITFLFAFFLIVTAQAWGRGLQISCGCFDLSVFGIPRGAPGTIPWYESVGFAVGRNALLLALSILLLLRPVSFHPKGR